MRSKAFSAVAVGLALSACAGRDPAPVASVQPQDMYADCTMIRAEIEANNAKAKELSDEPPELLQQMMRLIDEGADVVYGQRVGIHVLRLHACDGRRIAARAC